MKKEKRAEERARNLAPGIWIFTRVNPYSHLVIASKIEPSLKPENPPDYYWGAVAPDIRYVADVQRHQTHLPIPSIVDLIPRHPNLASFVQGYLVHCLTDEIALETILYPHLPFSLLKRRLSRQHLAVILEFFYLENEELSPDISGRYNRILEAVGLSEENCVHFGQFMEHYIMVSTPDARITELVQLLGLENDHRIETYAAAARNFQQKRLLKRALFLGIRAGRTTETLTSHVSHRLEALRLSRQFDGPNG
jgi:hypothetical protein